MPRTPDRLQVKESLHVQMSLLAYEASKALMRGLGFRSFSQLVETVIFWAQGVYGEYDDAMLRALARLKAQAIVCHDDYATMPPRHRAHLTLDPEAVRFLEWFANSYPALFETRNAALELICTFAAAQHRINAPHFERRLVEVIRQHPCRTQAARGLA